MDMKKKTNLAETENNALADEKLLQVTGGYDSPTINDEPKEQEEERRKQRPPVVYPDVVPYYSPDYELKP